MSDTFDHMADAFDSLERGNGPGAGYYRGFYSNPLYYHDQIRFDEIVAETDQAFRLKVTFTVHKMREVRTTSETHSLWVPKSICRCMDVKSRTVFVHKEIWRKIVNRARSIDQGPLSP